MAHPVAGNGSRILPIRIATSATRRLLSPSDAIIAEGAGTWCAMLVRKAVDMSVFQPTRAILMKKIQVAIKFGYAMVVLQLGIFE